MASPLTLTHTLSPAPSPEGSEPWGVRFVTTRHPEFRAQRQSSITRHRRQQQRALRLRLQIPTAPSSPPPGTPEACGAVPPQDAEQPPKVALPPLPPPGTGRGAEETVRQALRRLLPDRYLSRRALLYYQGNQPLARELDAALFGRPRLLVEVKTHWGTNPPETRAFLRKLGEAVTLGSEVRPCAGLLVLFDLRVAEPTGDPARLLLEAVEAPAAGQLGTLRLTHADLEDLAQRFPTPAVSPAGGARTRPAGRFGGAGQPPVESGEPAFHRVAAS